MYMDWNLTWLISGGMAFALALVNLVCLALGKTRGGVYMVFGSLSFGILGVTQEVRILCQWVSHGELAMLCEKSTAIQNILLWTVPGLILLNLIAAVLYRKRQH